MKTAFGRIIKYGFINFRRNSWLSLATVFIFFQTLFLMFALLFLSIVTTGVINNLKERIDISVYFKSDAPEERIVKIKEVVGTLEDIKEIEYVSRDEALMRFKERFGDKDVLMQALEELGTNPLQPVLNIKARDFSSYELIANFLSRAEFADMVDEVNYLENKVVIDKLSAVIGVVERTGFILMLFFGVNAILVAFNTIRLAIYALREEVSIMRLVGASNWYIRGPFLLEGMLYGITAAIFTIAVAYPFVIYISPKVEAFIPGVDMLGYFHQNFFSFFLLLLGGGVALGVISSVIAIRRYLRV